MSTDHPSGQSDAGKGERPPEPDSSDLTRSTVRQGPSGLGTPRLEGEDRAHAARPELIVRCPDCHSPQPTLSDDLDDVVCQACGSQFRLATDEAETVAHQMVRLGHFELVALLGSGGFGTVWKAYDVKLDRTVAVKIPRDKHLEPGDIDKFLREARAAAQLKHPYIVTVHEVGRVDDTPYLVQDLIQGVPLSDWLAMRRVTARQAAEIAFQIAEILRHAHEHGVIHRDLKPSNIMIDAADQPHLMDFGLARRERDDVTVTVEGQILGTPAYMSPEQAVGQAHNADARSDVYSLGVVFYRMLTGELPFRGSTRMLIYQVINDEAPPPRRLNSSVPKDLETVCLKCLEKRPADRYPTAAALAADLRRWLDGLPVAARPVSTPERAWRWCRRRPAIASLLAMVVMISLVSIATITTLWRVNARDRLKLAQRTVESYLGSNLESQRSRLTDLRSVLPQVTSELRKQLQSSTLSRREQALLLLALMPVEEDAARNLLSMIVDEPPRGLDVVLVREELAPFAREFHDELWQRILAPRLDAETGEWMRAAALVAEFDAENTRWSEVADDVVNRLVAVSPEEELEWIAAFRPVKKHLISALHDHYAATNETSDAAARALADYLIDDVDELVDLLQTATGVDHGYLVEALRKNHTAAVEQLSNRLTYSVAPGGSLAQQELAWQAIANTALALLELGHADGVWPLYGDAEDPRLQTYLIHWTKNRRIDSAVIIQRILEEQDAGALYALVLTLGSYDQHEDINPRLGDQLETWCWDTYASHPDSGVHAAIAWLLRKWGRDDRVDQTNRELAEEGIRPERDWYHNSLGQCMVIFRWDDVNDHATDAAAELSAPGWTFALAATETTRRDFELLHPSPARALASSTPAARGPIGGVRFSEAAFYCQMLSRREGLAAGTESLFWDDDAEMIASWEKVGAQDSPAIRVDLSGESYRLPTTLEWEFACRGKVKSALFFGTPETPFLKSYAWHNRSREHPAQVGSLLPNRQGLFDLYGNVSEWTLTKHSADDDPFAISSRQYSLDPGDNTNMYFLGGSFTSSSNTFRLTPISRSVGSPPIERRGFRIARTLRSEF